MPRSTCHVRRRRLTHGRWIRRPSCPGAGLSAFSVPRHSHHMPLAPPPLRGPLCAHVHHDTHILSTCRAGVRGLWSGAGPACAAPAISTVAVAPLWWCASPGVRRRRAGWGWAGARTWSAQTGCAGEARAWVGRRVGERARCRGGCVGGQVRTPAASTARYFPDWLYRAPARWGPAFGFKGLCQAPARHLPADGCERSTAPAPAAVVAEAHICPFSVAHRTAAPRLYLCVCEQSLLMHVHAGMQAPRAAAAAAGPAGRAGLPVCIDLGAGLRLPRHHGRPAGGASCGTRSRAALRPSPSSSPSPSASSSSSSSNWPPDCQPRPRPGE